MIPVENIADWRGQEVVDPNGEKLGKLEEIYFDGESTPPLGTGEPEFPELGLLLAHFASPFQYRPSCTGEVTWKDWGAAQADIDLSKEVMRGANATELFMTRRHPDRSHAISRTNTTRRKRPTCMRLRIR